LHVRGAVYDLEKLNWYNNYYIQKLEESEFAEYSWQVLKKEYKLSVEKKEWVVQIALLFRPQLNYFQELVNLTDYFFQQSFAKNQSSHLWLEKLIKKLEKTEEWEVEKIKTLLRESFADVREKKEIFLSLRSALTGKEKGPELPKVIFLLGKDKTIERLKT
jgi:nondiscriminating glutamyl-tRNA synthetase